MCCGQVFRHTDDDQSLFTLVAQTAFEVKEDADNLGELLIDTSSQPLSVKAGDMIGFHIVDKAVIPYDEDDTRLTTLFHQSLDNINVQGHTITMDSQLAPARTYSLRANIVTGCEFTFS